MRSGKKISVKQQTPSKSRVQVLWTVATVILLVVVGVSSTLYFSGKLPSLGGAFTGGYQNVTLTDAYVVCEEKARNTFSWRLKNLVMDDHSSRYDSAGVRYKIFINVELYQSRERGAIAEEYFINCYVRADNGRISNFRYGKDSVPSPASDNSNPFGFPR